MENRLYAFMERQPMGSLTLGKDNQLRFSYDPKWLNSNHSYPLSLSMPLTSKSFQGKKITSFFQGVSQGSTNDNVSPASILAKLIKECPGAVRFSTQPQLSENAQNAYIPLEDHTLERIASIGDVEGIQTGLNRYGQRLLSVTAHGGTFYTSQNGAPGRYLLKFPSTSLPGLIENEFICTKLAGVLGLNVTQGRLQKKGRGKYLMLERSDRLAKGGQLLPIHQESLSQSLGATATSKTQLHSYKNALKVIEENSFYPARDKIQMMRLIIYSLIIGYDDLDCDTVFLQIRGEHVNLAPFSGIFCGAIYGQENFSLPIQKKTHLEALTKDDLQAFCRALNMPFKLFHKELMEMNEAFLKAFLEILSRFHQDPLIDFQTLDKMKTLIPGRCEYIRQTFG